MVDWVDKTITFEVHHIDSKGLSTKQADEIRMGKVFRHDGEFLCVWVVGEVLPYKVHPDWIISDNSLGVDEANG